MHYYTNAMKNYANFSGRASRSDYWFFILIYSCISIAAGLVDGVLSSNSHSVSICTTIVGLAHFVPSLSIFVRRLHDTDRSGWWYLAALTIVGLIPLFVFSVMRGTVGPNRFGDDPITSHSGQAGGAYSTANLNFAKPSGYASLDPIKEIERLSALKAAGHLTQTEFEVMKASVFNKAA